ncbi:hypothetical protein [Dyella silvatica]|uniref:hypothetical protein n=1 Tax=Dyella silvatica TaxID=2992128 RepID=UPI002257440E|nr:hypothetical protein [Dyella silvatica]
MRLRFWVFALLLVTSTCQVTAAEVVGDDRQQAALSALMDGRPPAVDSVKSIALAPWPHAPADAGALWVVAALVQSPGSEGDVQLWTGVLRRDGENFRLLAKDHSEHIDSMPLLWNPGVMLDLIPYRISAQETAFGVRINGSYNSTAHSDAEERVSLYRFAGSSLTPVFTALTYSSSFDKDAIAACAQDKAGQGHEPSDAQQQACEREIVSEQRYVLIFSPQATKGYYDVIMRAAAGQPAAAKAARSRWNGQSYAPRRFDGDL